jgi:uncharacterized protein with gpF-like domain
MALLPTDKELARAARRKQRRGIPVKPNKSVEASLRYAMGNLWKQVLAPATESVKQMIREGASPAQIAQFIEDTLLQAQTGYGRMVDGMVDKWVMGVDREVQNAIHRTMYAALGVDLLPVLQQPHVAEHLAMTGSQASMLIKTVPQEYLGKVARAVSANFHGEDHPEGRSLLEEIIHIGKVSKGRAKVIARDQTQKLTSALNEVRMTAIGVETYRWATVGDRRVVGNPSGLSPIGSKAHRDHFALNRKLCKFSDSSVYSDDNGKTWKKRPASWAQGKPGDDIQCRCWAVPVIDPKEIVAKALARAA